MTGVQTCALPICCALGHAHDAAVTIAINEQVHAPRRRVLNDAAVLIVAERVRDPANIDVGHAPRTAGAGKGLAVGGKIARQGARSVGEVAGIVGSQSQRFAATLVATSYSRLATSLLAVDGHAREIAHG